MFTIWSFSESLVPMLELLLFLVIVRITTPRKQTNFEKNKPHRILRNSAIDW